MSHSIYRRKATSDEARVKAALRSDGWLAQSTVRSRAGMDTSRCALALYRLKDEAAVEHAVVFRASGGRPISIWRLKAAIASRRAA